MSMTFQSLAAKTIHLMDDAVATPPKTVRKGLRLNDLRSGETARIVRVNMPDSGCRKRLAELGLAEGMKVTVATAGDTLMLIIGGSRMGLAARCAEEIVVVRVSS